MNPRDFYPAITAIVDQLRAQGGVITGLHIVRDDGQSIGKPLPEIPGPQVSGLCQVSHAIETYEMPRSPREEKPKRKRR